MLNASFAHHCSRLRRHCLHRRHVSVMRGLHLAVLGLSIRVLCHVRDHELDLVLDSYLCPIRSLCGLCLCPNHDFDHDHDHSHDLGHGHGLCPNCGRDGGHDQPIGGYCRQMGL